MRPPLALVVFLALAPAAGAMSLGRPMAAVSPEAPADWRRDVTDERVKAALLAKGWRLEDDGRTLDPKTKEPVVKAVLDKAVLDLRQDARRAALETVNLAFANGAPKDPAALARLQKLTSELPPGLAAAVLDPESDPAKVRAMAGAELDKVAAYFDGGRTLADRQAAAEPVAAVPLGPRVNLPYFTAAEQAAGEKLRAAAAAEIGRDPVGKTVLARLNGPDGKPSLPAFLIEDLPGTAAAHYDFRRQAVVLDRSLVLDALVESVHPRQRAALRQSLSKRSDLLGYLDKNPAAVSAIARQHDVVLVHELTHAWQDRRDPVFREMARGNLPDAQPLESEEEAYKTKNLYIHSKLKNDPASVRMDEELRDYVLMGHGLDPWKDALFENLENVSPSRAVKFQSMTAFASGRIERVKARAVATSDEQRAKALDLQALTRAQKSLAEVEAAHTARMAALAGDLGKAKPESYKLLGTYYLVQALAAERSTDRAAWLDQAERYAKAAGEKALLKEITKARDNR